MSHSPPDRARQRHWDAVYARRAPNEVSWFEAVPAQSLRAIEATGVGKSAGIIDIGGGSSTLVDRLIELGFGDLTLLDVSATVLASAAERLGADAAGVRFIRADITQFAPDRPYALWHDRAVFHFLTEAREREAYRKALRAGTTAGSHLVIATFGPGGPLRCSGLDTTRYDASGLARELGDEFKLVASELSMHATPGGTAQQFLHARFVRV